MLRASILVKHVNLQLAVLPARKTGFVMLLMAHANALTVTTIVEEMNAVAVMRDASHVG